MPLKIHLRKGQKAIINGAVVENVSSRNVSLLLINNATVLRDEDILTPDNAATPASRIYYALQCLYLFPENAEAHARQFSHFIDAYVEAAPSSRPIVDEVRQLVDKGNLYLALKNAQRLIAHEHEVLADAEKKLAQRLRDRASAGEPEGG
jgi:flagellar protein FlbT